MNTITDSAVTIQTSSESMPSSPCWLGEAVLLITRFCLSLTSD
jgi:hypothetical protein